MEDYKGEFFVEVVESTSVGFGAGVVANVLFGVATGAIAAGSTTAAAISGPLVLALTGLGFGVGFAHGYRKMKALRRKAAAQ